MEIEGVIYGLMNMAYSASGRVAPGSGQANNATTQTSRNSSKKDEIIDLKIQNGVWVEDSIEKQLKDTPYSKVKGISTLSQQMSYDWSGRPVMSPINFKGNLVSMYA